MELTLQTNITLPVDTVSVGNVMVFVYDVDGPGGRLISQPANTSDISQASPRAQMVRQLKLEEANITLTSKLTKNRTTNQFQVGLEFKLRLTRSMLYNHSFVIRKVLFVVTSYSKLGEADDHQNDQLFLIFYTKSVVPSTVVLNITSTSLMLPISVTVTTMFTSPKSSPIVHNTVSPSNTGPISSPTNSHLTRGLVIGLIIASVVLVLALALALALIYILKRRNKRKKQTFPSGIEMAPAQPPAEEPVMEDPPPPMDNVNI